MPLKPDAKILVTDDMSTMRKMIKNMLQKMGHTNVEEADDGTVAWKMINEASDSGKPYDLIVSDWNMAYMSGLDLLKHIRLLCQMK